MHVKLVAHHVVDAPDALVAVPHVIVDVHHIQHAAVEVHALVCVDMVAVLVAVPEDVDQVIVPANVAVVHVREFVKHRAIKPAPLDVPVIHHVDVEPIVHQDVLAGVIQHAQAIVIQLAPEAVPEAVLVLVRMAVVKNVPAYAQLHVRKVVRVHARQRVEMIVRADVRQRVLMIVLIHVLVHVQMTVTIQRHPHRVAYCVPASAWDALAHVLHLVQMTVLIHVKIPARAHVLTSVHHVLVRVR